MKNTVRQLLSFSVAGTIGFVIDVGVLYLLAPVLGWYGARVLSFLAAATGTWAFNRRYTFASDRTGVSALHEYLHYLLTMLAGALFNYAAYVATLHWVAGAWAPMLGVAFGSGAGLTVNFLSARHLVFKARAGR